MSDEPPVAFYDRDAPAYREPFWFHSSVLNFWAHESDADDVAHMLVDRAERIARPCETCWPEPPPAALSMDEVRRFAQLQIIKDSTFQDPLAPPLQRKQRFAEQVIADTMILLTSDLMIDDWDADVRH